MKSKNIAQEVCSLMFSTSRIIRERHSCLSHQPIWTFPMAYVETARYIAAHQPVSMKELAEYLRIKPPSATAIVNQMIRAKLVVREQRATTDRRSVQVRISNYGQKFMKERAGMAERIMNDAFSILSQSEQKTLIKILTKVVNNVKNKK